MADVSIKSIDVLRQYLVKYKDFANAVDLAVLEFKRNLEKRKDQLQDKKEKLISMAEGCLDKLDYRISRLKDYMQKYNDMCPEDYNRFEIELERNKSKKLNLEMQIDAMKEKINNEIGIIDDLWNLAYSYSIKTRSMAETGNGALTKMILQIEKYTTQ